MTADGHDLGHLSKVGAFAEHTVVSTNSIVKVEPHLPLVPMRFAVVRNSYRVRVCGGRAKVRGGDTVVVIGVGGIGTGG